MYNFESEKVRQFLRNENVEKAAVQLPSGLRSQMKDIKSIYDEEGVEVLFLANSCYGSCDLADGVAEKLGCDALIHYGHSDMSIPTFLPTLYVECRAEAEPFDVLGDAISELRGSRWGLTTTIQHVDYIEDIRDFLEKKDIETVVGRPGPRAKYRGQVLGCDWDSATSIKEEVDGYIYIGTGRFHPEGIFLATGLQVLIINPVSDCFQYLDFDRESFFQKRIAMVEKARNFEDIGIVVSTKSGQNRLELAESLASKLEEAGYNPSLLVVDELEPEVCEDFQIQALVNTACPRISLDDTDLYNCPVLTPLEVEILLGEQEWENYQLDEIGNNFE